MSERQGVCVLCDEWATVTMNDACGGFVCADCASAREAHKYCDAGIAKLRAEIDRLRCYTKHAEGCRWWATNAVGACDCGLYAAVHGTGQSRPEYPVSYPCGCSAAPAEVPAYCPIHGPTITGRERTPR